MCAFFVAQRQTRICAVSVSALGAHGKSLDILPFFLVRARAQISDKTKKCTLLRIWAAGSSTGVAHFISFIIFIVFKVRVFIIVVFMRSYFF